MALFSDFALTSRLARRVFRHQLQLEPGLHERPAVAVRKLRCTCTFRFVSRYVLTVRFTGCCLTSRWLGHTLRRYERTSSKLLMPVGR